MSIIQLVFRLKAFVFRFNMSNPVSDTGVKMPNQRSGQRVHALYCYIEKYFYLNYYLKCTNYNNKLMY